MSFLPGISGKFGKPLWTFYANRGQLLVSFGIRDKNGAIEEFFPANTAYMYERTNGFKTFIKIDDTFHSFFDEPSSTQEMHINKESVTIIDTNKDLGLSVSITYFTLPNESLSGLVRRVEIHNLRKDKRQIEVLDGLTQVLPSGIGYGDYKAISNLLQSWMDVHFEEAYAFYKLRASTGDTTMVKEVTDGNFFMSFINGKPVSIIADIKKVFKHDTTFRHPHGFIEGFKENSQVVVNQVPCAYAHYIGELKDTITIESMIGYASSKSLIDPLIEKVDKDYFKQKQIENERLIEETLKEINTETNYPLFDAYLKQTLLDNVLRGGKPMTVETKDGPLSYHLYSRKHGDPERDYNFYVIEPHYFSQGNGNFRDVLQNRRNDNFLYQDLKTFNIRHFASLIQADGYNPLSIEGVKFIYQGALQDNLELLTKPYGLGELAEALEAQGYHQVEINEKMKVILKESRLSIEANFGEGFWNDHFTYIYDLIENYLRIYPDKEEDLLFKETIYQFFDSPIKVKPRREKTYLINGKVRQHDALMHVEKKEKWLKLDGEVVKVNLASKLLTLILTKFGGLDPENIGLLYEAEKPGWNDALNGLPGIFGSGVSEMIELLRLTRYFKQAIDKTKETNIEIVDKLVYLIEAYQKPETVQFDYRMSALEKYREESCCVKLVKIDLKDIRKVITSILNILEEAYDKARSLGEIIPTYLTYEVTKYDLLGVNGSLGYPLVMPISYKMTQIKPFLEGPARSFKVDDRNHLSKMHECIKNSDLYDQTLKMYKTSVDLDSYNHELGRIRAFTKGWLERESNFLHMGYKYLLGLIKSGLYEAFYEEIKTNLTCFMDFDVYGRSPLENSSFIATSNNPDKKNHGRGFVARLSGSTAEMLSMYTYMFLGHHPFTFENGELKLTFKPILSKDFFKDKKVKFTFYGAQITYYNNGKDLFDTTPQYIEVIKDGKTYKFNSHLDELFAKCVRNGYALEINVYF